MHLRQPIDETSKRHAAEEALRRNQEKFRRLLEVANILPWEADLETQHFTYVGPQAEALLGYPASVWLEENFWRERLHPEDRDWVILTRSEAVQRRQSLEFEYRLIAADGRVVWVHDIMSIISVEGTVTSLGGFILDITHRRETEESLRESKYLIEQIASASPVILYVLDLKQGEVLYVNGKVQDILGYSPQSIAAMSPMFLLALARPEEMDAHLEHLAALERIHRNELVQREFRLRSINDDWVWLSTREAAFKYDKNGEVKEIVGIASDITERRVALEQLQANEALFRKLAETTKVIPFEVDLRSGAFTYMGPQAEPLFGYPLSAWSRPGFWASLVHPGHQQAAEFFAPGAIAHHADFEAEFPLRAADGRYVWIRQILRRGAEDADMPKARGFLFDITESKEAEEEREKSRHLLRELAARSQGLREEERISLARELHDELGQSLTMLRLDITWLGNRLAKLAPTVPAVEPLQAKLGSMEQILQDTLQMVRRIISSLRPPVLDELGLREAIQWQASEFTRRVGIRCEVTSELVDPLPKDISTGVFRIFQEILTNVARHAQATRVEVNLMRRNDELILSVADNGRGFAQEKTVNGKSFGLLGMRERAWALGGALHIDSAPGKGTKVLLGLPNFEGGATGPADPVDELLSPD